MSYAIRGILVALLVAVVPMGCAVNPVTGDRELAFISEREEIKIGEEHYGPTQQSQGGPYTADPALVEYVQNVGQSLAEVSDRPGLPYEFTVINSSVPNAWALPGGKIAVNRGLLTEMDSEAELAAVLGHEIVHSAARHGARNVERGLLLQAGVMAVGLAARDQDLAPVIVGGAALGAGLIAMRYSRQAELEADYHGTRYMAEAGYDPHAAVELMETFVRLSGDREPGWIDGLFASHPPSQERVEANRQTAADLPSGGRWGRDTYQERIAVLRETQEGYDKADRAREALKAGEPDRALQLAEEAMTIEPREGMFHALKADALFAKGDKQGAETAYTQAIERNDSMFRYYLERGMVRQELGNESGARQDLERSNELLPTAIAHNALGNIALARGDERRAARHFEVAAESRSPAGREAATSLQRLRDGGS